tara:strand:- start:3775 stop:4092 length:318 start_codon:yes stop_codon:yes gene_type:complete
MSNLDNMSNLNKSLEFGKRVEGPVGSASDVADFEPVAIEKSIIESIFKLIIGGFGLIQLLGYLRRKLQSKNKPSAPVFFGIVVILVLFVAMVYASISESQGHSIM